MNNFCHNDQNGLRQRTPAMVMPSGQVIYWELPTACEAFYNRAQAEPRPAKSEGGYPAALMLLVFAGSMALVISRLAAF